MANRYSFLHFFYLLALFIVIVQGIEIPRTNNDPVPYSIEWRSELREARQAAAGQLQNNLITTLNGLAVSGLQNGANITKAIGTLTTAITRNTFDLVGVVGYMPKLLGQDLPTQLVEVLRRIRRNEIRVPNDVNSSIDTIMALVTQAQESGITENLFGPVTRFLPNLFTGTNDFLVTIFSSVFNVLGVNNNI